MASQRPNTERTISTHSSEPSRCVVNPVRKSQIVGYYSVDGDRKFLHNASRLRYYNPPDTMKICPGECREVHFDLDQGRDVAVLQKLSTLDGDINLLLEWIKLNHTKISAPVIENDRWIRPKFVGTDGTFSKMLMSGKRTTLSTYIWIIYAARWKGTIYLCTDKKLRNVAMSNERQCCSWKYKFPQYVLSESPDKLPDTSKPVIEPEGFRVVYQRNIGGHSVMFSSHMKGVLSKTPLKTPLSFKNLNFIKLETQRLVKDNYQEKRLRQFTMRKWWIQCYLTNTELVLCGFRDDSGVVEKLCVYNVDEIIEKGEPYWKPGHCVNYCKSFLTKVEETVVRNCTESIYKFERCSDGQLDIKELPASSEYAFLPSSFLKASG